MSRVCMVVDANDGPCVRSLFSAVARLGWVVCFFRPYGFGFYGSGKVAPWSAAYRWHDIAPAIRQNFIPVPGFNRFNSLSLAIVRQVMRSAERRFGAPDVVVYTRPYYAALVEESRRPSVYFAFDAYRYYPGWDYERVAEWESRIAGTAQAVAVVSRQMESDWSGKTRGKLVYLPNATHAQFVAEACRTGTAKPPDLAALQGPVVGCIGNIGLGYDWELIRILHKNFPAANFVFLGTVTDEIPELESIRALPNVHFMGNKEHSSLPEYLRHFDVCLNPMALNELNHRRCPLRLYDYLAGNKPVLSTSVREAEELRDYVAVGHDPAECVLILAEMLNGKYVVNLKVRRRFIDGQTWEKRAGQFMAMAEELMVDKSG